MIENSLVPEETDNDSGKSSSIPNWLTEKYLKEVLEQKYGRNYEILDFLASLALGKGENYSSILYRISVNVKKTDGSTLQATYLVKAMPEDGIYRQVIRSLGVFPREMIVYDDIIPNFERIYEDFGKCVKFAPACLHITYLDPEAFVLEDLTAQNFRNMKRQVGLDMLHVKAALKKLAEFHAASAVLFEKRGPFDERFSEKELLKLLEPMLNGILLSNRKVLLECMHNEWDIDDAVKLKMDRVFEKYMELAIKCISVDSADFNCLIHGDLWTNNIMYKHDDNGKILETYFVDFQMCRYGSPSQDLIYFLISSPDENIRVKEFDALIKYYHDELILCLKLLEYPKDLPKLMDLQSDIFRKGWAGVITATSTLATVLLDPHEAAGMMGYISEDENGMDFKRALYLNPRYVEAMKELLPFFDNRGYLDL